MNLKKEINKDEIESLIPHRKPFLLIDKLTDIVPMISATGVMNIKKTDFFFNGHFPGQPVMPGSFNSRSFWTKCGCINCL
jgi:3-hydroxyacyl-[acyl-carrier-protein] dehydratase